jgi:hypothetical protein
MGRPRRLMTGRNYAALARIVAEAEAEGILVLPLHRYGCVILCPPQRGASVRVGGSLICASDGVPSEQEARRRLEQHGISYG